MLLSGSGDELCGLLPALFQTASYHPPTVRPAAFQSLSTESLSGDELLAPPPFSGALRAPCPSTVCSFSVLCLLFTFFFTGWGGQSV
jgi:hypothetical protein